MKYVTTVEGKEFTIEIIDEHHVILDGTPYEIDFVTVGDQPVYSLLVNGESYDAHVYPDDNLWQIMFQGGVYSADVEDEREKRLRAAMSGGVAEHQEYHLRAPMPGLVVAVPVHEGQAVNKGEVLLVLESMKMQNELRSPRAGTVARLRIKPGDRVEQKDTMMSVV
jgi:biotin carboxyl carrier protein